MDLSTLDRFVAEVGESGPVVAVGGRTQWEVGGPPDPAAREVRAPAGIVAVEPAEMIVRVRAGTPVAELDHALAAHGQMCPLDPHAPAAATVGGVLAVGRSGIRRLRWGPVRDLVLEVRYVSAAGRLVKAGAPVVKNVTGFDLCRVLVGSLGTLGLIGEVVLRTVPSPPTTRWLTAAADPFATAARLHRPSSVLWDGTRVWILLEGQQVDIDAQAALLPGFAECEGPPPLPVGGRRSMPSGALRELPAETGEGRVGAGWVAEVGIGIVHTAAAEALVEVAPAVGALQRRLKHELDPTGRLNPGRKVAA